LDTSGPDTTELYHQTRERVTELCRTHGGDGTGNVAACPEWSVTQVVAHLTGVCADILAGNLGGAGTDPWTEQQVAARSGRSLAEVLDEWTELGAQVEAALAGGLVPPQLLFDTTTHEQDLRGALGQPGARDDDALVVGWSFALDGLDAAVRSAGAPALRVVDGHANRVVGDGEPSATVTLSSFEGLRAASGRRTAEEIAAYDWAGADPAAWISVFPIGPFHLSTVALNE